MSIWGKVGEFTGHAFASYFATRARKKREQAMGSSDFCPEPVKIHIGHGLNHCKPASKHYTVRGIQEIRKYLTKKQLLGAEIAIDTAAIYSRTST